MKKIIHAGVGKKRTVEYIPIDQLHLDALNPRLPEEVQGKREYVVLEVLYQDFDLDELAFSMSENGYFDEEPVVVVRNKSEDYTVVEGNRRIATIKILLDSSIRKKLEVKNWPPLRNEIQKDLSLIPAISYKNRDEVLPYLGVRHIAGIKKWAAYAKARYVASMVDAGYSVEEVQQQIGDRQNSARKHFLCYKLTELARNEFEVDFEAVKENFSYLMLAGGQGNIKRFIGLPTKLEDVDLEKPTPENKLRNLKYLFSWLFGEGKNKPSVLKESRDITNYLSHILASEEATKELIRSRDLSSAYELSDGEEAMVLKNLNGANKRLEVVLGIIHRHKTSDVMAEVKRCSDTVKRLLHEVTGRE